MSKRAAKMKAVAPSKAKRAAGKIASGEPVKLSIRVSPAFRAELKVLAVREGGDMQSLVLDAVAEKFPSLPAWRVDDE